MGGADPLGWEKRGRRRRRQDTGPYEPPDHTEEKPAKRGRKKRDRKHSKANHGKRPNAGSKAVRLSRG